jgi:hypothetical protein
MAVPNGYSVRTLKEFVGHDFGASAPIKVDQIRINTFADQAEDDPKSVLSDFRNAYYPRIAVTVAMIATGRDVKPPNSACIRPRPPLRRMGHSRGRRPIRRPARSGITITVPTCTTR